MTVKQVADEIAKFPDNFYIELSYGDEWSILSIPQAGQFCEALRNRPDAGEQYLSWDNDDKPWYAEQVSSTSNVITIFFRKFDQKYMSEEIDEFCKEAV